MTDITTIDHILAESHTTIDRMKEIITVTPDENLQRLGRPIAVVLFMSDGFLMAPSPSNVGSPQQTLNFCRSGFGNCKTVVR
jgi:hypothetical protein